MNERYRKNYARIITQTRDKTNHTKQSRPAKEVAITDNPKTHAAADDDAELARNELSRNSGSQNLLTSPIQ